MRRFRRILSVALLNTSFFASPSYAQVTIDVAKITCDQFLLFTVADPREITIWLSGYFNSKRDNTLIDPRHLRSYYGKVQDYCRNNLKLPVMQAAQRVLESGN
jgi:acid stress chaperone HdeB